MSVTTAGPGQPAQVPSEAATAAQVRRARLRAAVSARGIPLATILVAVAVVVFVGLVAAFGYPLVHGLIHFSQRLPSYDEQ